MLFRFVIGFGDKLKNSEGCFHQWGIGQSIVFGPKLCQATALQVYGFPHSHLFDFLRFSSKINRTGFMGIVRFKTTIVSLGLFCSALVAFASASDFTAFAEKHCIKCHGPEKQKGDLRIDTLKSPTADVESAELWLGIAGRSRFG